MNVIKPISIIRNGYCIRLANGQGWHITASVELSSWIGKLASIMELKACDQKGYPKLICIQSKADREWQEVPIYYLDSDIQENLPRSGWRAHKYPAIKIWSHRDVPHVICEIGHEESYELSIFRMMVILYAIFERALCSGGLPFHAALVERDGNGVLLAGSGNMGKSTCCHRLPIPWQSLCDDKTLVVRNDQKRYLAHPCPTWSDHIMKRCERTWNIENHIPLAAIFFLVRADIDEVIPMGRGEAAVLITQSSMQVCHPNWKNLNSEDVRKLRQSLFENACELANAIPAFRLRVSLNGRFWERIEEVLL